MAKFAHSDILDGGLLALQAAAIRWLLIKNYSAGDSYATVVGNKVAEVTMASGDYTIGGAAGSPRTLTTASGKSATASVGSGVAPNLHFAFTDNVGKVLWVTDETSDQVITAGDVKIFPSLTYTCNQPI